MLIMFKPKIQTNVLNLRRLDRLVLKIRALLWLIEETINEKIVDTIPDMISKINR